MHCSIGPILKFSWRVLTNNSVTAPWHAGDFMLHRQKITIKTQYFIQIHFEIMTFRY